MVMILPIKRLIIVGAGASFSYGLPLANDLLQRVGDRIARLERVRVDARRKGYQPSSLDISGGDDLDETVLANMIAPLTLELVAKTFREHLVQQNLDDFVRDHPSMTNVVSLLIAVTLFFSMYRKQEGGAWQLRSELRKSVRPIKEDWMRLLVGVVRPKASAENKLSIISFNYDSLLERSMKMYWSGSEFEYAKIEDAVEFVYPHGQFSDLPEHIHNPRDYLTKQAAQLKLGAKRDQVARDRAKAIVGKSNKIFSVGFSFSDDNARLLGFDNPEAFGKLYVQNYKGSDVRLNRLLVQYNSTRVDEHDMNELVQNGFFEQ